MFQPPSILCTIPPETALINKSWYRIVLLHVPSFDGKMIDRDLGCRGIYIYRALRCGGPMQDAGMCELGGGVSLPDFYILVCFFFSF